jgi:hypothetical protein
MTDSVGFYSITQMPPAHYSVTVSKQGFATAIQADVELLVNQNLEVDYTLQVGATTQEVRVISAPPMLRTASATLGDVVGTHEVVDLPLNGRQFTELILLMPGSAPKESTSQASYQITIGAGGITPSVTGQRGQQNNFTLDGAENNSTFDDAWAVSPPPDAIEEFSIQSHITDAQLTISSGANVSVAIKSGGNQLHGDMYEFIRNDDLEAANFFTNYTRSPKPAYRQNQFGATVGGPVMFPGYDGRLKKTYFFGYYEGFRANQGFTQLANVPTPGEMGGNFSDILTTTQVGTDSLGRPIISGQLYNPYSTRQVTAGATDSVTGLVAQSTGLVRDPLPGNSVPSNLIADPAQVTTYLKAFYPLPNYGPGGNSFPNYTVASPQIITSAQIGAKLNHTFGNNDTLQGGFYYAQPKKTLPNALLAGTGIRQNLARVVSVGYTHLFSPTSLVIAHYGYTYSDVYGGYCGPDHMSASAMALVNELGFQGLEPIHDGIPLVPQITLSPRLTSTCDNASPQGPQRNHEFAADFQKVRGSHTLGAGFLFYHYHQVDSSWSATVGFDQYPTSAITATGTNLSSTGDGLASMLLNLPSTLKTSAGQQDANTRTLWQGYYAQDNWQATRKLNVQIGLRWDFVAPVHWKNNEVSGWNPECPVPASSTYATTAGLNQVIESCMLMPVPFTQVPTAANPNPPSWAGPNVRSTYFDPKYNGWQPRLGFAYKLPNKMVLRTAFAVLDDHADTAVREAQDPRTAWPWSAAVSEGGLNRGVPTLFTNALPTAASFLPPNTTTPQMNFGADPRLKIPYVMEYNFGLQDQLTPNLSLSLDYVGSESRHLFIQPMYNAVLPQNMGPGPVAPRTPFPFFGQFSYDINQGRGNYNGLLVELERRFSQGVSFRVSYTYSKCLSVQDEGQSATIQNPYDINADYGDCDFNFPHIFVASYAYRLPFGNGRRFASGTGRSLNALIGGWQASGIATFTSGPPLNVSIASDNANIAPVSETERASRVPGVSLRPPGFQQNFLHWYNPAAFAMPAPDTFGNVGRNILRAPRYQDFDFVLSKDFKFTESKYLELRGEFYNIFNNVNFGTQLGGETSTSLGSSTFMEFLGAGSPRDVQLALKFVW